MSPASPSLDADSTAALLGLAPHPEGGEYVETWRDGPPDGSRGAGTAIYFLLRDGPPSRWHRLDAAEVWHFYAGAPLELRVSDAGGPPRTQVLGTDLIAGERPQAVVPAGAWQSARTLGPWTLVGCTVAPAFSFDGFELAAPSDGESPPIQDDPSHEPKVHVRATRAVREVVMADVTITPRDNGPYRVEGPVRLVDAEGGVVPVDEGRPVFLCRCGQSANKPFCDGTHRSAGFQSVVRAPKE